MRLETKTVVLFVDNGLINCSLFCDLAWQFLRWIPRAVSEFLILLHFSKRESSLLSLYFCCTVMIACSRYRRLLSKAWNVLWVLCWKYHSIKCMDNTRLWYLILSDTGLRSSNFRIGWTHSGFKLLDFCPPFFSLSRAYIFRLSWRWFKFPSHPGRVQIRHHLEGLSRRISFSPQNGQIMLKVRTHRRIHSFRNRDELKTSTLLARRETHGVGPH